ncbi:hypothetical protein CF326_g3614 [Tilletia indica]|nr:hypothetical protein CF326_g3614 [Tilletia indica]
MKAWSRLLLAGSALAIAFSSSVHNVSAAEAGFIRAQAPGPIHIPLQQHIPPRPDPLPFEYNAAPLRPRARSRATRKEVVEWANAHRSHLRHKYRLHDSSTSPIRRDAADTGNASPTTADVRMTNYRHDSSWLARVRIGTPPAWYTVIVDTGSSDCWLSTDHFKVENSTTFVPTPDAVFDVQYGSGNVSGIIGHDIVSMGSGDVLFVSEKQVIAIADKVTSSLKQSPLVSGIMGFAFESLAGVNAPPFWLQANISDRRFAIFLERQLTSLTDVSPEVFAPGGSLTLGGVNSSLFIAGSENPIQVLERSFWLILLDGLSVGNQQVKLGDQRRAAIDTGTTLIGGPDAVIAELYSKIPGAEPMEGAPGYYTYPCSSSSIIEASMAFGGQWYTLPDIDFVGDIASSDLSYCMGAFFGLGSFPDDNLQWIIGGAFLKNTYTIFDAEGGDDGKPQVVFASLAPGLNSGTQVTNVTADVFSASAGRSLSVSGFFVATAAFLAIFLSAFV